MLKVRGAPEVAPVVFVSAEGEDLLALGGKAQVSIDDGEDGKGSFRPCARREA